MLTPRSIIAFNVGAMRWSSDTVVTTARSASASPLSRSSVMAMPRG